MKWAQTLLPSAPMLYMGTYYLARCHRGWNEIQEPLECNELVAANFPEFYTWLSMTGASGKWRIWGSCWGIFLDVYDLSLTHHINDLWCKEPLS